MVKKLILAAAVTILTAVGLSAQENQVKRLPEIDNANAYREYTTLDKGFFFAAELSGGYSCRLTQPNFGFTELDAIGGYRFNEYIQVGAGIGARYYFRNEDARYSNVKWAGPIFAELRGNIMPAEHRKVVPYYSVDLGGTLRDGFMFRPTFGLRIGQPRNAFLVAISYLAQDMSTFRMNGPIKEKNHEFVSFMSLKIGYQF